MNHTAIKIGQRLLLAAALVFVFHIPARADDSASLFKSKCAMCHAANGSGDSVMGKKMGAKDLRSAEIQKKSDAELTKLIADGVPPKMPAYKAKLSDAEIKGLVGYIRELGKK
jgi:cytochrome c6